MTLKQAAQNGQAVRMLQDDKTSHSGHNTQQECAAYFERAGIVWTPVSKEQYSRPNGWDAMRSMFKGCVPTEGRRRECRAIRDGGLRALLAHRSVSCAPRFQGRRY